MIKVITYGTYDLLHYGHIGSKGTIFFVLTMQIFFWLYSLTGNCLYDTMFGFYSISIGFILGYLVQKKNIKEEIYNEKDRNINIS